ncbi:MAG: FecR family protein [Tannerella sp.]|jgi:ferric-dicitrate binding protein FerR (iron transport regulator)|nr:FecR family protein [Tannerella sp.]
MVFKEKKQENTVIDLAWDHLYQRLEKDGLLPEKNVVKHNFLQSNTLKTLFVAAVLIACIFSGWYFTRKTNLPDKELLVLYNEVNAPTLATMLEDGSVIYLSEQASLKYPDHFAEDKREVILQGEAFFEIKKQSERPFFIDTDLARVEVVGTSFNVKSDHRSSFLLSVREGVVRVTQKSRRQALSVKTGETVLFDSEQLQLIKTTTGFDEYFKRILFKDEHLKNVAAIINMHSDSIKLKIDPEIEQRAITFTLSEKSSIAEIAEVICLALELEHARQKNTIYISKQK